MGKATCPGKKKVRTYARAARWGTVTSESIADTLTILKMYNGLEGLAKFGPAAGGQNRGFGVPK